MPHFKAIWIEPIRRFFVAEEHQEVVGYVVGILSDNGFTAGFSIDLDLFYVRPDKRGTRAAAELIKAFNEWADRLQPDSVFVHMANSAISSKMTAFLHRYGFSSVGSILQRFPGEAV